jgi:hypothetical protein
MYKKITWTEPNRPPIPSDWYVIIDGNLGTAYEDLSEYLQVMQDILDEQARHPNPLPPEE